MQIGDIELLTQMTSDVRGKMQRHGAKPDSVGSACWSIIASLTKVISSSGSISSATLAMPSSYAIEYTYPQKSVELKDAIFKASR